MSARGIRGVRLPTRLFVSYAAVAVIGAAAAYVTVRLLAAQFFDRRMSMMGGMGQGGMAGGPGMTSVRDAFTNALDAASVIALVVGIAASALAAAWATRRLLRPLEAVRAATRRIAAGDYTAEVPAPSEPELAALAGDVSTLAGALADTEARRVRLLGDVAHEMRTPLTCLDGYVEGIIDGVFPADAATLGSVAAELHRLHRLADDLAELSRAAEHRLDLRPVDTDAGGLARQAAARLAPQFEDGGVALVVRADEELPVHADADRVTQVLTNLLGNALVATPPGGEVRIEARRSGETALLTVTDTGAGLDEVDQERIFERFYRVAGQPRRSGGSGVGLTIAREIIDASGGSIRASSPGLGQGTTLRVTLPLRQAETQVPPGP